MVAVSDEGRLHDGGEGQVLGVHDAGPGLLGGDERVGVGERGGERLLDQHRRSCRHGGEGLGGVHGRRGGHDHRVGAGGQLAVRARLGLQLARPLLAALGRA